MSTPVLTTKLFIPRPQPRATPRPRLIRRLNDGLHRQLTLFSAPAGSGKTTLVTEWVPHCPRPIAWLALDAADKNPVRFLTHFVAALQTIAPDDTAVGRSVLGLLNAPAPSAPDVLLTTLVNEIAGLPQPFVLVLDDYHLVEAPAVDQMLTFLLAHQPPHFHLAVTTREDPALPLPRLRARGQLTEIRAADLRFTAEETAAFLNESMGLSLSADNIAALETRTEGWIAGLQLAALALQGQAQADTQTQTDTQAFIDSFTGGHQFVLDYLLTEVLDHQPPDVQAFLLRTSMLDRLCGPLCAAVLDEPLATADETLTAVAQANLFLIPLDHERRWYRYHHLFGELLRQRLAAQEGEQTAVYHRRAAGWYEENGMPVDAFRHATAVPDIDEAVRLLLGDWVPLHFRGAVVPVLDWLSSLPAEVLDARPILWVMYASALSMTGRLPLVEPKLHAAETALADLPHGALDEAHRRNIVGHIAAIRALLAVAQQDVPAIIAQSHRALDYLHPHNTAARTATTWKLGLAHQLQGDFDAAQTAYRQAISGSRATGNTIILIGALQGLAEVQTAQKQLAAAADHYREVLTLTEQRPQPAACAALLGLAHIHAAREALDDARDYGRRSLHLAQTINNHDRALAAELFLAQMALRTAGDVVYAADVVARAEPAVTQTSFAWLRDEVAAVRVALLQAQGHHAAAVKLAAEHDLPPPEPIPGPLVEPLSDRELEVLVLVAEGLSNQEISDRLFIALSTVKGHNRRIFGKLQVENRTEAAVRGRELGLLP